MDTAHHSHDSTASSQAETQQPPARQQPGPNRLPARVPSGVPGLDAIMHGGFLRGGIYIISGQPGTGKTILSNQIAFGHVASGGRALYVNLLSESPSHMFTHLSSLSFFNHGPVGDALYYVSGYGVMQKEGLIGLGTMLQRLILDHKATLLIIDGALNAEQSSNSALEFKAFAYQLQVFGEATGCTVLLLMSTGGGAAGVQGEANTLQVAGQTTVDGLIQLGYRRIEMRLVREIEVRKLRGSSHIEGGNAMQITSDGIEIYPRLEALLAATVATSQGPPVSNERMAFGLPGLDEMLGGGIPEGSSTLLLGPSGSGKTLIGLHFLMEGARQGQPGLYFGLSDPLTVIMESADRVGMDLRGRISAGEIEALWHLPVESIVDQMAGRLLEAVRRRGVKRLFIDSLDSFSRATIFPERTSRFFTALLNELRFLEVCTVSSLELPELFSPTVAMPLQGVSAAAENTIFIRSVELNSKIHRLISILKLQRSGYDPAIREFTISEQGITVGNTFAGVEGTLTGLARPLRISETNNG
ncbi:MAG TPA: ATPase domain-containing protein [Chloroflexia bacterium]|nr:ATPase domain-containing protein [Chloroflexia bacterium]